MKTKVFTFLIFSLLFASCYTTRITPEFLYPSTNNSDLFSYLDYRFNENSFNSVFAPSRKIIDETYSDGKSDNQHEIIIINQNQNLYDAKSLIKKYANVPVNLNAQKKGELVFDVTFYDSKSTYFLRALSVITFGTINLLGLPSSRYLHTIEIEASVYSSSGELIKTYSGFGRDQYLTGVYYHSSNQKRASFLKAVKNALAEIDYQITLDKQNIAEKLHIES